MLSSKYTNFSELPLVLNMHQAAEVLGISSSGMYELSRIEGFPSFKVGKRVLILRDAMKAWLEQQSEGSIVPEDRRYG